jgi:hypothetical protein
MGSGEITLNKPLPPTQQIAKVEITLDSVIYDDGQIWGPDTSKFYKQIWERYNAAQAVVKEIAAAKNAGENLDSHFEKIHTEAQTLRDRQSSWKDHYAGLLKRSPNLEGTLKQFQEQAPLPEFRHIGDKRQ